MSVTISGFPGCCTGYVLSKLDAEYNRQHALTEDKGAPTAAEQIEREIRTLLSQTWKGAFVLAATNDNSKVAIEVLKKIGFKLLLETVATARHATRIALWGYDLTATPVAPPEEPKPTEPAPSEAAINGPDAAEPPLQNQTNA